MFHQPGWILPNGHTVRSHMEARLCEYYTPGPLPHRHGAPETDSYEVAIAPQRQALYVPSLLFEVPALMARQLADDLPILPRLIVVEPLDSVSPGGGLRRLIGFRQAHRAELFLAVVARRALHRHIPTDAFDLLVPLEDFSPLDHYLATLA